MRPTWHRTYFCWTQKLTNAKIRSATKLLLCAAALMTITLGCSSEPEPKPKKIEQPAKTTKSENTGKSTSTKIASETKDSGKSFSGNKSTKTTATKNASYAAPKKTPVKVEPAKPDVNDPEFHEVLLTAVDEYLRWGMVNVVAMPAPTDCRPVTDNEPKPLLSSSDDADSHGKKLYFLFAKDIVHYLDQKEGSKAPVGQAIMKEAWTSKESNPQARNLRNHASGNRINPRTKVGDKMLEIGKRNNFFVMTKLAEDTPNTDEGWVYGVIDSETKKVLTSGAAASCMNCHTEAKYDRQFGSTAGTE